MRNFDDFMRTVKWEETDDGIITANSEDIPMIEEFLEVVRHHQQYAMRAFIEKYGGTWHPHDESFRAGCDALPSAQSDT